MPQWMENTSFHVPNGFLEMLINFKQVGSDSGIMENYGSHFFPFVCKSSAKHCLQMLMYFNGPCQI